LLSDEIEVAAIFVEGLYGGGGGVEELDFTSSANDRIIIIFLLLSSSSSSNFISLPAALPVDAVYRPWTTGKAQ
jgi:hypothetical protein